MENNLAKMAHCQLKNSDSHQGSQLQFQQVERIPEWSGLALIAKSCILALAAIKASIDRKKRLTLMDGSVYGCSIFDLARGIVLPTIAAA